MGQKSNTKPLSEKRFHNLFYHPKFTVEDFFRLMLSVMVLNGKNAYYQTDLNKISEHLYKKSTDGKYPFLLKEFGFRDIGGGAVSCPDLLDAQSSALTFRLIEYRLCLNPVPRQICISLSYANDQYIKNTWISSQVKKILKDVKII